MWWRILHVNWHERRSGGSKCKHIRTMSSVGKLRISIGVVMVGNEVMGPSDGLSVITFYSTLYLVNSHPRSPFSSYT